jgi:hypothetical protein
LSEKGGLDFKKASSLPLNTADVRQVVWTEAGFAAAAEDNLFLERSSGWTKLVSLPFSRSINRVTPYEGGLWVAGSDGVFHLELPSPETAPASEFHFDPDIFRAVKELIRREPSALEVQRAAVRYSNTGNGKIRSWQILSRLKALVPDLSYSIAKSRGNSIDLDRGGTADPDRYITGPETWDKDRDVNLSWDLGEILFSTSQTSIDSRDKLMVELREEIVSEVTRLYFERRRLQMDLLFEKPDGRKLARLMLEIEERTAQIDGLTGGWFSRRVRPSGLSNLEYAVRNAYTVDSS